MNWEYMLKKLKKKKDDVVLILLVLTVSLEILFLVYMNFFHIQDGVDQDFAKLIRHVVEMGRNRTLFLDNWSYLTTGEQDCAAILAVFFYLITGKVYFSYALANVCDIFIWLGITGCLLRTIGLSAKMRFILYGLLFTAYDFGMLQYTNMLFYGGAVYIQGHGADLTDYNSNLPTRMQICHKVSGNCLFLFAVSLQYFKWRLCFYMRSSACSDFIFGFTGGAR